MNVVTQRDGIILHLEWLGQALALGQQILKTSIVVGIAPSKIPGPLCWGELLPEGPWHCWSTPVFSWFELLAANNLLILTTYYLPWYHMFMHWRLNMYFDTCLFIMYVLVCKMRYSCFGMYTRSPNEQKGFSRALAHCWVNAGLLSLADPNFGSKEWWLTSHTDYWLLGRFDPKNRKRSSVSMCRALEFLCSAVLSNVAFTLPKMMQNQHSSEDRLVALMFSVWRKGCFNNS